MSKLIDNKMIENVDDLSSLSSSSKQQQQQHQQPPPPSTPELFKFKKSKKNLKKDNNNNNNNDNNNDKIKVKDTLSSTSSSLSSSQEVDIKRISICSSLSSFSSSAQHLNLNKKDDSLTTTLTTTSSLNRTEQLTNSRSTNQLPITNSHQKTPSPLLLLTPPKRVDSENNSKHSPSPDCTKKLPLPTPTTTTTPPQPPSHSNNYKQQKENYLTEKRRITNDMLTIMRDEGVIVLADWLKIRGSLKNWIKLYVVLKPGIMMLFKSEKMKPGHWVGTVLLNSCQLLERPSKKHGFCFKLFHPLERSIWAPKGPSGETYISVPYMLLSRFYLIFRAPSQKIGNIWMEAIELILKNSHLLKTNCSNNNNSNNNTNNVVVNDKEPLVKSSSASMIIPLNNDNNLETKSKINKLLDKTSNLKQRQIKSISADSDESDVDDDEDDDVYDDDDDDDDEEISELEDNNTQQQQQQHRIVDCEDELEEDNYGDDNENEDEENYGDDDEDIDDYQVDNNSGSIKEDDKQISNYVPGPKEVMGEVNS
jgi:hypothetical protein